MAYDGNTAVIGSGAELFFKKSGGGFVSIGEVTSIDDPRSVEPHDVTPVAATPSQQNYPGMRSANLRADFNWRADLYSGAVATTDLIDEWTNRRVADYARMYPSGAYETFRAWIRELSIEIVPNRPVTSSIDLVIVRQLNAEAGNDGMFDRSVTSGPAATNPTSAPYLGSGLQLRVAHTTSDTPIIVAQPRRVRLVLGVSGEPDATNLESNIIERIPALRTIAMDFDVNLQIAAIADYASHWPETGSATQPSLWALHKDRTKTKWQIAHQNEPGSGGNVTVWTFNGFINEANPGPTSPGEVLVGSFSVTGDGDLTESTEAKV